MADPTIVAIPEASDPPVAGDWVLVTSNATGGQITIGKEGPLYSYTYRDAGGGAPADFDDARNMKKDALPMNHDAGMDVYFYCRRGAGSVIVER